MVFLGGGGGGGAYLKERDYLEENVLGYTWDRLQNKFTHCKRIRNNTGSRKTTGIQEQLNTACK
jgi:hypothetical protein